MEKNIIQFLIKAKKSTYAGASDNSKKILKDGSREFKYANNLYTYRDRYFGYDPFAGEEVIFSKNRVVWIMNYWGHIIDETVNKENTYNFLKQALREVDTAAPFRGPSQFEIDEYKYNMKFSGSVDCFVGLEKIYYENKKIYELFFHGGNIAH